MTQPTENLTVVIAEDDPDDRLLIEDAFKENDFDSELQFVENGQELLDYLRSGREQENDDQPQRALILLDLNMPKMDGREALRQIRDDEQFRMLPVVVLTTSKSDEDVASVYAIGANSFISKPATFSGLVDMVSVLDQYWSKLVRLPNKNGKHNG